MRAAWLWAWTDIRRRWASLALVGVLVALALGAASALVAGSRQASTAFERYFADDHLPDILVSAESATTASRVEALVSDPRIASVERAEMVAVVPAPIEPGSYGFTLVGTAGSLTGGFGRPRLVEGRYPAVSSDDEIVVNERAAMAYGLRSGQRVQLQALQCARCPAEPVGEATIVGVVRLATDLTADPQITGLAVGGPAFLDGRWRDFFQPASWLGIHVRNRHDVNAVIAQLSVLVSDGDVANARAATSPLDRAGRWQRNALAIAAIVVALAGMLVVTQALARHLSGRPDDPRVLTAMGLTPVATSAAGIMATMPAIVGGTAGGVAVTVALSPLLPLGVIRRADRAVGVHVDAAVLVLATVAALVIMLSVTWLAASRWARPCGATTTKPTLSIATRVAVRSGLRPVPATGAQFAVMSGQGRTRLPVVPVVCVLAGAVTLVAGALVVRWSLDGLIGGRDRYGQSYDARVSLDSGDGQAAARQLATDPRVRDVAFTRQGAVNVVGRDGGEVQVAATGIQGITGRAPVAVLEGRAPAAPHEIALASATMSALDLHPGDRTMASGACGQLEVLVVGRVIVPLTSSNYPDDGSILTLDGFDELCASANVASFDVNASALVRLRHPNDLAAVRKAWEAQGFAVSDPEIPNSVSLVRELRAVPVIVAGVVALLGSVAAGHALLLTVRRRRQDLAVLRVFGLQPRQAGRIIVWQAATLAVIALAVGLPLGLLLGGRVWTAIAGSSNVVVRVDVSWLGLAVLAAGAMAIPALLSIWPARRAACLRPTEALRAE
jgi:ABC-type lipoprotein release transport system permease subunit